MFEDYTSRMEFPNSSKRWDQPLFTVREEIPLENIWEAITDTGKNKPRDPVSTKPEQQFDENFVQELDRKCQEVINFLVAQ
jgi:tRNA uridine 5-carbamoylmethylation protein Kti12